MSSASSWVRRALPASLLLIVPLAVVELQVSAHALSAPSASSPAAHSNTASSTPTFTWTRLSGASTYEIQVDNDPDFGSPVRATTANRRWVPTSPLPTGLNHWRVRGLASGVQGPWSSEVPFTVTLAAGPTLKDVTPTPLPQPSNPPLLEWSPVPGALSYEVEVATEAEFLVPTKATTSTTSHVVSTPAASEEYFWRVRGVLGSGIFTQWSSPGSYLIGDLAQVRNHAPANAATVEDVVLSWDPVPGAVYYDLRVGLDPDLNTWEEEILNIRGTQYSPAATYNNNDGWYWKVRAVNATGEKIPWADVELQVFQRQWLDAPELVHPANHINPAHGDDFYYQWTPVQHATHYELWVGSDPNFSPTTYKICKTSVTTYTAGYGTSADPCAPHNQGQVYYWRVRAMDAPASPNVQGIFSPIQSFIYNSGPVELVSPAHGAAVQVPTLKWKAQRDAQTYHVRIEGAGTYATSIETYALSWTPPALDITKGPFTWTVQAKDANGSLSPRYPGRTFTVVSIENGAAPLTPLSGDGEPATARFPSLSWAPTPDAAYYRVRVGVAGSGFWQQTSFTPFLNTQFKFPAATDWGNKLMVDGTSYNWQVRAFTAAHVPIVGASTDADGWGQVGTFAIQQLAAPTGQRLALSGRALDTGPGCAERLDDPDPDADICGDVPATPVLDWDPVPEASHYMVYIAEDRELTNLVYPVTTTLTTNSRWTPHLGHSPKALADNDANKAYYWYVRPCKHVSDCGPDPISRHDSALHAFAKVSPKIGLQGPADGAVISNGRLSFSWEDYLDANLARTYAPTGEPSHQTAQKYRIEVSETNTFNVLVDSAEVDQVRYAPWKKTYPEGQLYWRVQAIDAQGNRLSYSDVRTFTKSTPPAVLTAPLGGVVTNGLQPFRWAPRNHARNYSLEVYKNGDTTFSSANKVFGCLTSQTACTNTKPFTASPLPYVWRVRWLDADNRPGPWSTTGSFRSAGQAPGLGSPAAGSYVRSNEAYFTWTRPPASTGATYFRYERRPYGSSSNSETVITQATAYAPTALIANGTWQWRVTALDAARQAIASSTWRTFKVDTTRPTVKTWSPSSSARPWSSFVVTFSEPVRNVTRLTYRYRLKGASTWYRATVSLSADRKRAVLNPYSNMRPGRTYVVQVTSNMTDLRGNRLVARTWTVKVR